MKLPRISLAFALALAATGCEDNLGLPVGDLGGLWIASSYEFAENGTSQTSGNLITGGASLTITIDNSQNPPVVGASFDDGNGGGWQAGGTVDIAGASLTIGAGDFAIVQDGEHITLTNPVAVYSFPTGAADASVTMELDRL